MPLLQQQHITYGLLSPRRYIQTKYVACMPNATAIMVCLCYHGSKISIATNATMVCCCPKEYVYQNEACMLSNSKVMQVLQSVHGNKSYHGLLLPQGTRTQAKT